MKYSFASLTIVIAYLLDQNRKWMYSVIIVRHREVFLGSTLSKIPIAYQMNEHVNFLMGIWNANWQTKKKHIGYKEICVKKDQFVRLIVDLLKSRNINVEPKNISIG